MRKTHKEIPGKKPQSLGSKIFDWTVILLLLIVLIAVCYPLIYVVSCSISDPELVRTAQIKLFPRGIQFESYQKVFSTNRILIGYRNTVLYTLIGTVLSVSTTVLMAYALSRKDLYGRKLLNWFIAIPMWFGGGLIPTYLVVSNFGLVNNPAVVVLLGMISSYNVIICRTFLGSLPYELQEAAMIDGASDFKILMRIVMPVSVPILAVLILYYAVGLWNSYFTPMIYLNDKQFYPLQVFLREILLLNQSVLIDENVDTLTMEVILEQERMAATLKHALIVVATLPLMIVYPMLQKYFAKGVMVGSIKG